MTDSAAPRRRMGFTSFPEAPITEEGVAAVLVTKDDGGNYHAYPVAYPGREEPDPEIVDALRTSVEIRNL